jgi:hypothetical protein
MRLIFVDDSKQTSKREHLGKLIALGAVSFPAENVRRFADSFVEVMSDFGVPPATELKWAPSKNSWFRQDENSTLQTAVRERILQIALENDVRAMVIVQDLETSPLHQISSAETNVLTWLFERIERDLDGNSETAIVIFDKPGGGLEQEDTWLTKARLTTEAGTRYVPAKSLALPILTAPSHHHPQIQLADLIVGAVTGAVAGNRYGLELMPFIKPLLRSGPRGLIAGFGLKIYPDRIHNLHYWVHGEKHVMYKWHQLPLPLKHLGHFSTDDGLGHGLPDGFALDWEP